MKSKRIYRAVFNKSALFFGTIFFICILGTIQCGAQSVVGKWKRDMTIVYQLDKATGKQVPLSADKQKQYADAAAENGYVEFLEFKSDGTYTSTVTAAGDTKTHTDHYSISGKNLDMNIPLIKGEKTIITIETLTSAQMTWNLLFMNKLTGIGYKRI
jgi:hypothetical protein